MDLKIVLVFFAMIIASGHGLQSSNDDFVRNYDIDRNYDISRNRVPNSNGFSLRDIWDLLVGGGYGYPNYGNYPNYPNNYPSGPGVYPSGPGYPGQYPGSNYPQYPHNQVAGPPGAHPGCPLCDSSVYGYCSRKQEHDACCCDGPGFSLFGCRRTDCKFLYANSCQEHKLITNCCCIDLLKNSVDAALPVAPVVVG